MRRTITVFVLLVSYTHLFSQDEISYAEQLRALENEIDSLSIFNLIDSLFTAEVLPDHELNLRAGFTSNVTSAGRDFDIGQSGFAPGVSFYHKSGLYADLSGYWNSGVDPSYNPTILSLGYLGSFKNTKWSYTLDGERWFYNPKDSSENPLSNSLGASLSYDLKLGFISVDYSFLFGNEEANRIIANLSGNVSLGKWWVFEDIRLFPSVITNIGNGDITQLRITNRQISERSAERISQLRTFENLNDGQSRFIRLLTIRAFRTNLITETQRNSLLRDLRNASILSPVSSQALTQVTTADYEVTEFVSGNEFGVLNYAFTLPISLTVNTFSFLFSYTYSIPIQLPGEFIEVEPIGYFGASISYRIPFK
ncbi:MAG: hypothetical protein AAFY41_08975 [Bacteroidota bacterium]